MKAKELAALLLQTPDADVCVGYEEQGCYGTGTPFTDDVVEPIRDVRMVEGQFVFTSSCFLYVGERIWSDPSA